MKLKTNIKIIFLLVIFSCANFAYSQVVCSLDKLLKELMEDLVDNGKLDCLRKSTNPNEADETEVQRKRRIAANWDGDCSFESEDLDNQWQKDFLANYKIESFVNVEGKPSNPPFEDFNDQADMCEIVRALVGNGAFSFGKNMENISLDLLDMIDCPGGDAQSQICAATGGSFADKKSWVIFLNGHSIKTNKIPVYRINNEVVATEVK